jgi:hypothetical protein
MAGIRTNLKSVLLRAAVWFAFIYIPTFLAGYFFPVSEAGPFWERELLAAIILLPLAGFLATWESPKKE